MNIFRLDDNPVQAAADHCDKHCVKMIVETAQMLRTAHSPGARGWYNNPCAVWARASSENYYWLYRLGAALCEQYTARYGRVHANQGQYDGALAMVPAALPRIECTAPPLCMPEHYKGPNAVVAYRRFYVGDKMRFARWAHSASPAWLDEYMKEYVT